MDISIARQIKNSEISSGISFYVIFILNLRKYGADLQVIKT